MKKFKTLIDKQTGLFIHLIKRTDCMLSYEIATSSIPGKFFTYKTTKEQLEKIYLIDLSDYDLKDYYVLSDEEYNNNLIESAEYGYNYHKETQFPHLSFKEFCLNNFKQKLSNDIDLHIVKKKRRK